MRRRNRKGHASDVWDGREFDHFSVTIKGEARGIDRATGCYLKLEDHVDRQARGSVNGKVWCAGHWKGVHSTVYSKWSTGIWKVCWTATESQQRFLCNFQTGSLYHTNIRRLSTHLGWQKSTCHCYSYQRDLLSIRVPDHHLQNFIPTYNISTAGLLSTTQPSVKNNISSIVSISIRTFQEGKWFTYIIHLYLSTHPRSSKFKRFCRMCVHTCQATPTQVQEWSSIYPFSNATVCRTLYQITHPRSFPSLK